MSMIYYKSRIITTNKNEQEDNLPTLEGDFLDSHLDLNDQSSRQSSRLVSSSYTPYDLKNSKSMSNFRYIPYHQIDNKNYGNSIYNSSVFSPNERYKRQPINQTLARYNPIKKEEDTMTTYTNTPTENIRMINSKDYLNLTQQRLQQNLQSTINKLAQSEQKNNELLKQKILLEADLMKVKSELQISNSKARWYQKYAEDKDFQAKAVYWRSYLKQLDDVQKNYQKYRNAYKF